MIDEKDKKIKHEIAEALGNLAELIIRRQPPFDSIPIIKELSMYLVIYYKYKHELEKSLADKLLDAIVFETKYRFLSKWGIVEQPIIDLYHENRKIFESFSDWIRQKLGPYIPPTIFLRPPVKVHQIVKTIMKERKPEYVYDKSSVIPGFIPFSKKWGGNNKFFLVVDKGTKRQFLSFFIGVQNPYILMDIAKLFGESQSSFYYETADDVVKHVHNGWDIIDIILPHFLERIEQVLADSKVREI